MLQERESNPVGFRPRVRIEQGLEQARFLPESATSEFLFPENLRFPLAFVLGKLRPEPLSKQNIFLLRRSSGFGEKPFRGAFWRKAGESMETAEIGDQQMAGILHRADGVVVFLEKHEGAEEILDFLTGNLGNERKVWILEKSALGILSQEEEEVRLAFLESAGLVARRVRLIKETPFCLWYGRKEKGRGKMAVDLTTRPWFRILREQMIFRYQLAGWKTVDAGEIFATCQASTFPPNNLRNLKYGFGVKLEAYCGCLWHVYLDGSWTRLVNCPEEDCDGLPKQALVMDRRSR